MKTAEPIRPLPVSVRPKAGERAEMYVRRLARANHLRPSYLRTFAAGPPQWRGAIKPGRLAALAGRSLPDLRRALTGISPRALKPNSNYVRLRHAEKPALYAAIRAAAEADPTLTVTALMTQFRAGNPTIRKALASPVPPPWKPPLRLNKPSGEFIQIIETLLENDPDIAPYEAWSHIVDTTDLEVSRASVSNYLTSRRRAPGPGSPTPGSARRRRRVHAKTSMTLQLAPASSSGPDPLRRQDTNSSPGLTR